MILGIEKYSEPFNVSKERARELDKVILEIVEKEGTIKSEVSSKTACYKTIKELLTNSLVYTFPINEQFYILFTIGQADGIYQERHSTVKYFKGVDSCSKF